MQRILALGYALVAYLVFFATFLWLIAFLADVAIFPTTVNDAVNGTSVAQALDHRSCADRFVRHPA